MLRGGAFLESAEPWSAIADCDIRKGGPLEEAGHQAQDSKDALSPQLLSSSSASFSP